MSGMHDSGERRTFSTGAVRDQATDKPRPDLTSPFAEERIGEWLRLGAIKYAPRNWEKGMPISQCVASMVRHILSYKAGRTDEDHLAAIAVNAQFIMHYEHEIISGRMDPALDDMPRYESGPLAPPWIKAEGITPEDLDRLVTGTLPPLSTLSPLCRPTLKPGEVAVGRDEDGLIAVDSDGNVTRPEDAENIDTNILYRSPVAAVSRLKQWIEKARRIVTEFDDEADAEEGRQALTEFEESGEKAIPWAEIREELNLDDDDEIDPARPLDSTFYIAGPMRGLPHFNFPAFDGAASRARNELGYDVISPAELDREAGIDDDMDREVTPQELHTIIRRDCDAIVTLDPAKGDGLILLPGWSRSVGARAEVALALWAGLRFLDATTLRPLGPDAVRIILFNQE